MIHPSHHVLRGVASLISQHTLHSWEIEAFKIMIFQVLQWK